MTFEEWRHTYADAFKTDDDARAAWTAASNNGYRTGVRDTRELLAAHSAGAKGEVTRSIAVNGKPTEKGIYAWVAEGSASLVHVHKRPTDHSPGNVLNGSLIHNCAFYDGCAIEKWTGGTWYGPLRHPAAVVAQPMTDAARDVLAERRRHLDAEGWTQANDDELDEGELAIAAACYAESAAGFHHPRTVPHTWPFAAKWWKPTTPRRDLEKAGALILAEVERIDRNAAKRSGDAK